MEVDNTLNLLSALVMKAAGCHIWVWPLSGDCPSSEGGAAEITG